MPTFIDELKIMRKFLRDPAGNIWTNGDLMSYWNDAQKEIAIKAGDNERAESHPFPPKWTWSYLYQWEQGFLDGDRYQCFVEWEADGAIVCYPWEPGYWLDSSSTSDDGYRFAHPWEGCQSGEPADVIPIPLHVELHDIRFAAYDEGGIDPTDRKVIAERDPYYRTSSGEPIGYWRPDIVQGQVVLYPRPASPAYNDMALDDVVDDAGSIVTWNQDHSDNQNHGVITETVDAGDALFVIYEAIPRDVESMDDEIDMAPYLVKYIRHGALERAYGADTDGFMPTMRDFWKVRKEIGIRAIKKLQVMRKTDRDYQLGGGRASARPRHPRLPSHYNDRY